METLNLFRDLAGCTTCIPFYGQLRLLFPYNRSFIWGLLLTTEKYPVWASLLGFSARLHFVQRLQHSATLCCSAAEQNGRWESDIIADRPIDIGRISFHSPAVGVIQKKLCVGRSLSLRNKEISAGWATSPTKSDQIFHVIHLNPYCWLILKSYCLDVHASTTLIGRLNFCLISLCSLCPCVPHGRTCFKL